MLWRKLTLVNFLEHLNPIFNVAAVDGVLEARGEITTVFGDLGHSRQLLLVTSGEVQERQLVKVSLLLVGHLNRLVVTVSQSLGSESAPQLRTVEFPSHLNSHLQVAALQRKLEAGLRVLYELQRNLRVPLLLQVGNDTLTDQA